jgi:membrane-bound serine protease (ClpP class)
MRRAISLALLAIISVIAGYSNSASSAQPFVYRIELADEVINPIAVEYIETSIKKSETDGAAALLIQLDTPGGLLTSTRKIVKAIMNAQVPVLVYVAPSGARAGSAGVFITLASHVAAMAPSTNIGAAHPVEMKEKRSAKDTFKDLLEKLTGKKEGDEKSAKPAKKSEDVMDQKIMNDAEAWARSIAAFRGRNQKWAVEAVSESVSATENEAFQNDVVDFVVASPEEFLSKANGLPAMLPKGRVAIETKEARIIDLPMSTRLKWLNVLAHPNIAYILLMLGFYGLLFEFTHPGVGFPGIAGAICLVLAFFGLQVLPTNYAGVALIVMAIILFIAEVKITSYGLLTLGGIVSLFLGSLILFASPYEFMRVSLPIVIAFVAATAVVAIGLATLVIRSQRRKTKTGEEGLIGAVGEVQTVAGDHIQVFVHGEIWDAVCDEKLEVGQKIKVVQMKGLKLTVTKT